MKKIFTAMMCALSVTAYADCLDSLPQGNNPTSGAEVRAALQCMMNTNALINDATWHAACVNGTLDNGCTGGCLGSGVPAIACRNIINATGGDSFLAIGMGANAVQTGAYFKRFLGTLRTQTYITINNDASNPAIRCGFYAASGMPTHLANFSSTTSSIDTEMVPARINPGASRQVNVAIQTITSSNKTPAAYYYLLCLAFDPSTDGAPNATISGPITATWG